MWGKVCALLLFTLLMLTVEQGYSQCTGCTTTINTNASPITVNAGNVVCVTTNFSNTVTINGGTLCIAAGKIWSSASITITGNCTIINNGTMSMSFAQNSFVTLQNYGTISGGYTQSGGSIENFSTGKFTPTSFTATGGTFLNDASGTVTFLAAISFPSGYNFTNNGKITIPGFTVASGATVALTGTTQTISGNVTNNGTFTYAGPGTITGTMTTSSTSITNFSGGVTISSTFANSGTVNLNGSLTVGGLYSDVAGTIIKETGTGCNAITLTGGYVSGLGTFDGNNTALQVTPTPVCVPCLIHGAYGGTGATPTTQPSALSLSLANLTVNGSFTAATTTVNGYIILRSVNTVAPVNNPTSGTAYAVGAAIGPCTVVANITDATSGTKTFSDIIAGGSCGKNVYYRIFSFQGCGATIKYNITTPLIGNTPLSAPTTANAGSTISQCGISSFTMAANNPAIGVGAWSIVSGSPTIANTALYNTGVTLAAGQTATLKWTINSGGCAASTSNVVLNNTVVTNSFSQTNVSCFGGNNGLLTATGAGGTAPYSYVWSTGDVTQSIDTLSPGTFTVTITDANTCSVSASASVTQPAAPLSDSTWSTDVSFYGANNGSVGIVASGGTTPYTYHWATGATTQNLTSQFQGDYFFTITDNNGCTLVDDEEIGTPGQVKSQDMDPVTPNLITALAGTYVIAMDNTLQKNGSGVFNIKAYGLAMTILNNKVALTWVIKAGKGKDSVDFTAPAIRLFPSYQASASRDFKGGPFLILPTDTGYANIHTIVNTFNAANSGSPVSVYQLTASTVVDSRYALTQIPKAAILNDGGNAPIHVNYFVLAGVPTSNYFVLSSATHLADSCYNFASEPHNTTPTPGVIDSIHSYINAGGNFLAQCHAITTYEDSINGRFQTSGGFDIMNTSVSPLTYGHPDLPFQQYEGGFDASAVGGSVCNWELHAGSILRNNTAVYESGTSSGSTIIGQSMAKLGSGVGHLIFYSGGHDYGKTDANCINGMRSYFNAMLTPCNIINCNFLRFDNDISLTESEAASNLYLSQRDTFKLVAVNNGPSAKAAANITITNQFPAALTIISTSASKGSYNQATGLWTVGNMALNETDTLTIIASGTTAGAYSSTAFINRNVYDYYQSNDTVRLSGTIYTCFASAGPDMGQCNSQNFTMAANSPCIGTGKWTVIGGVAAITTASSPTTNIKVNAGVTATLIWAFNNGSGFSADTIVLTNYAASAPGAEPNSLSVSMAGLTVSGSFNAPASLTNINGYIVFRNIGNSAGPNVNPVNNTYYTVGNTVGAWTVAAVITDSTAGVKTFTDNLASGFCGNNVYYEVVSFNLEPICITYGAPPPLKGNLEYSPIYTWNKTTKNDYTVPGNWTPTRAVVQTCDILYVNNGGTDTLINVPAAEEITALNVQSNSIAVLQPSGAGSVLTFLKDPGSATGINVQAGSTLEAGATVQFAVTAAGQSHQIDGVLKTADPAGFSGTTSTTFISTFNPATTLGATSTVFYNASSGSQTVTARNDYHNITFANNATKTLAGNVLTTGAGNTVTITAGTVDALTYSLSQAAATNLTMTGGTLRMAMLATTLPQLTGTYSLSGGTVELYGTGAQVLRGAETYYNLLFSGSGTTTLSTDIATGTNEINGNVLVKNTETVDVQSYQFGSPVTTFTMTGGRFRTSYKGATVPMMGGAYNLTAGTVELYGTLCGDSQIIRSGVTYYNVDINAVATSFTSGNVIQSPGVITVASGATFNIYNPAIYTIDGASTIVGPGSFAMGSGSGLFYGNVNGVTPASCGTGAGCGNILTVNRTYLPGTTGYIWSTNQGSLVKCKMLIPLLFGRFF